MDRDLRRLTLTAAAVLVVLLVGRTVIASIWDADGSAARAVALQRKLRGEVAERPDRAALGEARRAVTELRERLDGLVTRMRYERPPEFDVPAGASPDLRYIEVLRREKDALVQRARFLGRSVPIDLGMPVPPPTGLEDVLTALRGLHIVHAVVSAALDAGIQAVDEIRVPPPSRRGERAGRFVRAWGIEFDMRGPPRAVHGALAAILEGTPYLALDDLRLESLDEDGKSVRCRMTAAALGLDPEQSVLRGDG